VTAGRRSRTERRHPGRYERIYAVVSRIPRGRVATYGQIAELAGLPGCARQVGYALHALARQRCVPWQRVINARGEVSVRSEPGMEQVQRQLLESEGVAFAENGRVLLARYQWRPRGRRGSLGTALVANNP
jgi:methylated-DNA-protein-cysteine methyltransferase-like protein